MTLFKKIKCWLLHNDCYKKYKNKKLKPVGVVVHSTDPADGVLSRFVQPFDDQTTGLELDEKPCTEAAMRAALGKNKYGNHWNRSGVEACVHAFIGRLNDGSYAVCETLPTDMPCWGAGSGKNGSYNGCRNGEVEEPLYVQFEMIEDKSGDPEHCKNLYNLAIEYVARLAKQHPTIQLNNIVSHKEAHARGCATDHGDPEGYWKRCKTGFSMTQFRKDVENRLKELEEIDMTKEEFQALFDENIAALKKELTQEYQKTLTVVCSNLAKSYGESLNSALVSLSDASSKIIEQRIGKNITDISDIPWESVRKEMRQLLDDEVINGGTSYDKNPDDVKLPLSLVRALVISKRYTELLISQLREELGLTSPLVTTEE